MKTKHIIIGLAILIVILFIVQKKENADSTSPATQNLSNEAVQNIAKIYADTNNEAVFNNVKITGDLNVSGKLNILPAGTIVAFNSATAPAGWALCDGQKYKLNNTNISVIDPNGIQTPDLRGRFILGTGQGTGLANRNIGEKGGDENVTLTAAQMPSHSHELEVWGDPNGDPKDGGKWTLKLTDRQYHNYKSADNRGHRDRNNGNRPVKILDSGSNKSHNNMPPYYVLTYIMKL